MPRITGADRVTLRLNKLGQAQVERVGQALQQGGLAIQEEAQHMIVEGSVSGKHHEPSLPGEPPNNNWGTLKNNIESVWVAPLRVEVSSNAPYAAALEFGTSKMAARPYMAPATERKRKAVVDLVRQAVSDAIKSTG